MRIYQVNIESTVYGLGFRGKKIAARTCEEAIRKTHKFLASRERVESVELLAASDWAAD